ncbi:UPF0721 transmembrane protein [Klenkia taihuensis]|nr:UPF0721 transmembrane protein [Klenkia taihuensis]
MLIGVFGFAALSAVIVNKAMSLVVVTAALPARLVAVPFGELVAHWSVVAVLLSGSLAGAWLGAGWAVRMRSATLHRVLGGLLVLVAVVLLVNHAGVVGSWDLPAVWRVVVGALAGVGIGVVAALLGVAGGELLIPTVVLLFGVGITTAGSLSLVVSLPTMLVAFARYRRDAAFAVLRENGRFVLVMAAGSVAGTVVGGLLLGVVPGAVLVPLLVLLLLLSAVRVWRH